jgi:hypothetical protein
MNDYFLFSTMRAECLPRDTIGAIEGAKQTLDGLGERLVTMASGADR